MSEKIHCDLLDIYGVNWSNLSTDKIKCIISEIHSMELLGSRDELYGFVGTTDVHDIIGGFFMIQFPTEFLTYDRRKTAKRNQTTPAERVFFVLLPQLGRILLQNRRFQILPIKMETVHSRLKIALNEVFKSCNAGSVISISPTSIQVSQEQLIEAYRSSSRVSRIKVKNPDARRIPEDFVYYNPQRERNLIIRDSRLHDYPKLEGIDVAAKKDADLRETHLGMDLVYTVRGDSNFLMTYWDNNGDYRVLRKLEKPKYEFYADIESETLSIETLQNVIERLEQEAALGIPSRIGQHASPQLDLFNDDWGHDEDD